MPRQQRGGLLHSLVVVMVAQRPGLASSRDAFAAFGVTQVVLHERCALPRGSVGDDLLANNEKLVEVVPEIRNQERACARRLEEPSVVRVAAGARVSIDGKFRVAELRLHERPPGFAAVALSQARAAATPAARKSETTVGIDEMTRSIASMGT